MVKMSYFVTSRDESVPLPVPGFPNMSIRSVLPSLHSSTPARRPWREKGSALPEEAEFAIARVPGMVAARIADAANLAREREDIKGRVRVVPRRLNNRMAVSDDVGNPNTNRLSGHLDSWRPSVNRAARRTRGEEVQEQLRVDKLLSHYGAHAAR